MNKHTNKYNNLLIFLYILINLSYILIYINTTIGSVINILTIILSYYLLIKYKKIEIILFVIMISRCINGFIIPGNNLMYNTSILLTFYIPPIIFILLNHKHIYIYNKILYKYKSTITFILLVIVMFFINYHIAEPLLFKRIMPIIYFLLFIIMLPLKIFTINKNQIIIFFRLFLITSLITYILPNYLTKTTELYLNGTVFNAINDNPMLGYVSYTRNQGQFFDGRILGIFSYLFLYLSLISDNKYKYLDILISTAVVFSTVARGAIMVQIIIIIGYIIFNSSKYIKFYISFFTIIIISLISLLKLSNESDLSIFVDTMNPNNENNAISQRQGFSEYSLSKFYENPSIGNGIGSLTSKSVVRSINVGEAQYSVVSDAYIFSLLGEMGLIGFSLFILSLCEIIINKKSILSICLFIGYITHLIGTDIPDIFMYYFAILVILTSTKYDFNNNNYNRHRCKMVL